MQAASDFGTRRAGPCFLTPQPTLRQSISPETARPTSSAVGGRRSFAAGIDPCMRRNLGRKECGISSMPSPALWTGRSPFRIGSRLVDALCRRKLFELGLESPSAENKKSGTRLGEKFLVQPLGTLSTATQPKRHLCRRSRIFSEHRNSCAAQSSLVPSKNSIRDVVPQQD